MAIDTEIRTAENAPGASGLRLARAPRWLVGLFAVLTVLAIGASFATGAGAPVAAKALPQFTDLQLYRDEVDFARHPSTWYASTVAEMRLQGYPIRSFGGVRPPVLALLLGILPGELARRLTLGLLGVAVIAFWSLRLSRTLGVWRAAPACLALATGVLAAFTPRAYLMHECWAGLLIALSLALHPQAEAGRGAGWLAASLIAGLAAAFIRELAAPFLGVMALAAFVQGRRREAAAWVGAMALFCVMLAAHTLTVQRYTLPSDLTMNWVQARGWRFLLGSSRWNALIAVAPGPLAAILLPPALVGVLAWSGPLGRRLALTVMGYAAGFLLIGRPEDTYWGLMIAPLLPLGWIGAAGALAQAGARPRSAANSSLQAQAR